MSKGIVDVDEYDSATELRRPPPPPPPPPPAPYPLRDPEDSACESPNIAVRGLVYGPELEENAGVVLGGVIGTDGAMGAGMGIDIPGGGGTGR